MGVVAALALSGLVLAACGESGDGGAPASTETTAVPTADAEGATTLGAEPTGEATESPREQGDTARPGAEARDGEAGPGLFGGVRGAAGFGGAAMVDAVINAVAEATGMSIEAVQALEESGTTFADVLAAEGADREAVVDQVVEEIQASLPAGRAPGAGGPEAGGRGGAPGGGGRGDGALGGAEFDIETVLRDTVNALIDGEELAPPEGFGQAGGMVQVIVDIVGEQTGREPEEVQELRAEGRSYSSMLFGAGLDLDTVVDEIVVALEAQFAEAERPEGAPESPTGDELREAVEAIMTATDEAGFGFTVPAAPTSDAE